MIGKGLITTLLILNILENKKKLKLQKGNRQNIWAQFKHTKTQPFNTLKGKYSIPPVIIESHIKTSKTSFLSY